MDNLGVIHHMKKNNFPSFGKGHLCKHCVLQNWMVCCHSMTLWL